MRNDAPLLSSDSATEYNPETEILALSAQTARMIAVAQTLVASQRYIDVQGLQDHVGLLCAKALDLPPSRTGFLKLELRRLLSALDELTKTLRVNAA